VVQSYTKDIRKYLKKQFDANDSNYIKSLAWLGGIVEGLDKYVCLVLYVGTNHWSDKVKKSFSIKDTGRSSAFKKTIDDDDEVVPLMGTAFKNRKTLLEELQKKKPKTSLDFIRDFFAYVQMRRELEKKKGIAKRVKHPKKQLKDNEANDDEDHDEDVEDHDEDHDEDQDEDVEDQSEDIENQDEDVDEEGDDVEDADEAKDSGDEEDSDDEATEDDIMEEKNFHGFECYTLLCTSDVICR
jgi:cobalamin biosynthesis protein CobT